jgi:1-acyl-sn-glycerol-3-phosphate acyltransferase
VVLGRRQERAFPPLQQITLNLDLRSALVRDTLRSGGGRRRLLLRRLVAQGPNLAVFQRVPVDRTGLRGRHDLGTSLLDDGVPLLLFPEGTRSRTGEMGAFKPGAAALCISRDVPCLPVAIVGAAEAMLYGQNWPTRRRLPVYVTYGEPMRERTARRSPSSPNALPKG